MNFHANPMKFSNAARDRKYWDDFYRTVENGQEQFMPPSQFAAFCCSELKNKNIVNLQEIACYLIADFLVLLSARLHS